MACAFFKPVHRFTLCYIIPDDWNLTVDTFHLLDSALHRRRFVAYGKEFKRVKQLLNL